MEYRPISETLTKLRHGGNSDSICYYAFHSNDRLYHNWPQKIATTRTERDYYFYDRRKYSSQEEGDPGEISYVDLKKLCFRLETYKNNQKCMYKNGFPVLTENYIVEPSFWKYIAEWLDKLLHWSSNFADPNLFLLELKNACVFLDRQTYGTFRSILNCLDSVDCYCPSYPPCFSTLKRLDINDIGDKNTGLSVDHVEAFSFTINSRYSTSPDFESKSGFIDKFKRFTLNKCLQQQTTLRDTESKRGAMPPEKQVSSGTALLQLLFVRTMENKITQKITPAIRSRQELRPACKADMKTPDHKSISSSSTTTTTTKNNNNNNNYKNNCCNRGLINVSPVKLDCVCIYSNDVNTSSQFEKLNNIINDNNYNSNNNRLLDLNSMEISPVPVSTNILCTTTHSHKEQSNVDNDIAVNKRATASSLEKTNPLLTQNNSTRSSSIVSIFFLFTYLTSVWPDSWLWAVSVDTSRQTNLATRPLAWKMRNYIILVINILTFFTCAAGECKVSTCQKQWPTYHINNMDIEPMSDTYSCRALRTTWHCIRRVSHGCMGNIDYHSEKSRVQKQMSIQKCSMQGETYDSLDQTHKPPVHRPQPECMYKGKGIYKHCGLFGDPHLRTFNRVCQTCKIRGAWALVDNNHLTVMVTNKPVVVDGSATATSMLTVRIRRNELCGANHFVTYETQANNLPSTFDDGRTHYGAGNGIELKVLEPNRHIKIHIKYIDTTILVRQIGRYFTFALWMPEEVVDDSNGNVPELCVRGCPKSEQINYQEFLAQKHQKLMEYKTQNKLVMSRPDAESLCRQAKVVDFYFDSCVFDLMTTGDRNFTVAAYSALQDLLKLNPEVAKSNKNRTDFRRYDQRFSGSSSNRIFVGMEMKLLIVLATLLSLHAFSRLDEF